MKDSLSLSDQQCSDIYTINMQLHQQKMTVRQQHAGASLQGYLQQVENKRDSLYGTVLPADKYQLYKQKKMYLLKP